MCPGPFGTFLPLRSATSKNLSYPLTHYYRLPSAREDTSHGQTSSVPCTKNRVVVRRIEPRKNPRGGIIIPDTAQRTVSMARFDCCGPWSAATKPARLSSPPQGRRPGLFRQVVWHAMSSSTARNSLIMEGGFRPHGR